MKRVILSLLALLIWAPAHAQSTVQTTIKVVDTCGTATYSAGKMAYPTQDATGVTCTNNGGGGGGGPVTIADGASINLGSLADPAWSSGNGSITAILKTIANAALASTSAVTQSGTWNVGLSTGSNLVGKFGIDQTTPGTTNAVVTTSVTTGGDTAYGLQTAASTNSTLVSTGAHTLRAMNLINTTTTIYYLRMYDSAGAPTCSSATGYSRTWPIPPATAAGGAGGIVTHLSPTGVAFAAGLSFCVTGGPSSTDNTNAATGVFINLDYK